MLKLDELHIFSRPDLLELALTHRSFANEQGGDTAAHNERLEFLGDSVLGAVLSAKLMAEFPTENEGALSKRRASLVNEERLAEIATSVGMAERLRLGKGELKTGGASKPRILACGLEAYIGAVFLDGGFNAAKTIIETLFIDEIGRLRESGLDFERDFKTRLQEYAHGQYQLTPSYVLVDEFGPAHARCFKVVVRFGDQDIAIGEGRSKKAAEQEAARAAIESIKMKLTESAADAVEKEAEDTK